MKNEKNGSFPTEIRHIYPTVSVLMITYNHEKFIRQALDSILMQEVNFEYEICIGEDESTDGTSEICKDYAKRFPEKIRLFLRERKNHERDLYKAPFMFNFTETLKACRGKYVAFLEGDDFWSSPHKLQRQVDVMENNPEYTMCFHNTNVVYDHIETPSHLSNKNQKSRSDIYDLIDGWYIMSCSLMFRNNLIQGIPPFFYDTYNGDYALELALGSFGDIYYIDDAMGVYRRHASSFGSTHFEIETYHRSLIKLLVEFDSFTNYRFKKAIKLRVSEIYCDLSKVYMRKEKLFGHLKCILLSLINNPRQKVLEKNMMKFNYTLPVRIALGVNRRLMLFK